MIKFMNEAKLDERFGFGKNWESYSELIDLPRLTQAKKELSQFLGTYKPRR